MGASPPAKARLWLPYKIQRYSCHPADGSLATSSGWALASLQDTEIQLSYSSWESRHQLRLGSGFPARCGNHIQQSLRGWEPRHHLRLGSCFPARYGNLYSCHWAAENLETCSGLALASLRYSIQIILNNCHPAGYVTDPVVILLVLF